MVIIDIYRYLWYVSKTVDKKKKCQAFASVLHMPNLSYLTKPSQSRCYGAAGLTTWANPLVFHVILIVFDLTASYMFSDQFVYRRANVGPSLWWVALIVNPRTIFIYKKPQSHLENCSCPPHYIPSSRSYHVLPLASTSSALLFQPGLPLKYSSLVGRTRAGRYYNAYSIYIHYQRRGTKDQVGMVRGLWTRPSLSLHIRKNLIPSYAQSGRLNMSIVKAASMVIVRQIVSTFRNGCFR